VSDEMQSLRDCDFLTNIKSYGGRESPVSSSWDESGEGSWSCFSSKSNVSDVRSPKLRVLIGDVDVAHGTASVAEIYFYFDQLDSFCPSFSLTHLQTKNVQLFSHRAKKFAGTQLSTCNGCTYNFVLQFFSIQRTYSDSLQSYHIQNPNEGNKDGTEDWRSKNNPIAPTYQS
jgi:hypothetical protein